MKLLAAILTAALSTQADLHADGLALMKSSTQLNPTKKWATITTN